MPSPPQLAPAGPEPNRAVQATGLVRTFDDNRAVDGLDLTVDAGTVHGLLGPNGAGKTTIIRMLATLLRPTAGSATVFGHDIVHEADAVRRLVSMTGQFASVDEELTGHENLVLLARLWGYSRPAATARAHELLHAFDLEAAGGRLAKTFSGGMRRRLDIAASIVVTPRLIFLDEPTTGLDPRSRNQVWDIVRAMVEMGTTVLLTTQYLDEADQLADRISVIDRGRVVAEGTRSELKASVGAGTLQLRVTDPADRAAAQAVVARVLDTPVSLDPDPTVLAAAVDGPDRLVTVLTELSRADVAVAGVALGQPSLDEVFLAVTGHPATDAADTATATDTATDAADIDTATDTATATDNGSRPDQEITV